MRRGGEHAHVDPDLGDQRDRGLTGNTRNRRQSLQDRLVGGHGSADPGVEFGDRLV